MSKNTNINSDDDKKQNYNSDTDYDSSDNEFNINYWNIKNNKKHSMTTRSKKRKFKNDSNLFYDLGYNYNKKPKINNETDTEYENENNLNNTNIIIDMNDDDISLPDNHIDEISLKNEALCILGNLINDGLNNSNNKSKKKYNQIEEEIVKKYNNNTYDYFNQLSNKKQKKIIKKEKKILKINNSNIPIRFKILNSNLDIEIKALLVKKLEHLQNLDSNNNEYHKLYNYVHGLTLIPFGKYKEMPININNTKEEIQNYIINSSNILNNAVYGHNKAKFKILQIISKWISNPISKGNVFSIIGPMGNGKTTLVKEGIAKMINRPFFFISLGGATDSSFLDGHSYTYEGSIPGKIVELLKRTSCMNPVIYFDELDKVSDTPKGQEIINLLIHLTDFSQNDVFTDKYYSDIPFDLSKCLFIFSLNNIERVNPILKDRMETIYTDKLTIKDKIIISKKYIIPSVIKDIKFKDELIFTDEIIEYIINNYTNEEGVRNLKRCFENIITKINLFHITNINTIQTENKLPFEKDLLGKKNLSFPLEINHTILKNLIENKNKNDIPFMMYS